MTDDRESWDIHLDPNYDSILTQRSADAVTAINGYSKAELVAFLKDTRGFHGALYGDFVRPGFEDHAGRYRGEAGTTVETYRASVELLRTGKERVFFEPADVAGELGKLDPLINALAADPAPGPGQMLRLGALLYRMFGAIHPYADGTGHIQRLMFVAVVQLAPELALLPSWTIHPRPFDEEFALALEDGDDRAIMRILAGHVAGV